MKKHLLGYVAIALVCMMVGSTITLVQSPTAQAEETTVVVTSPFTKAIAEVRGSVVGVNNYQTVRYSNGNSYSLDDFFDSFGFGGFGGFGGYGNGYGNGYGSSRGIEEKVQEVLAGTGSGVVVGEGYVLTNFHVVEDATRLEISVKEEGKEEPTTYASTLVAYDENLDVAVIYAPKTGKATLRASASTKAKSLGQCEAGRIVVVLKGGSTFTRVLYDGKEGCILTSALTLCGAVPEEDFSTATLSYKGRTDSSATISVYTATNGKRRIDQWRVGNDVVVLDENGSWTEVEIDGWHGFVKSDYLQ